MTEQLPNPAPEGFLEITKAHFFAIIGQLDVNPRPRGNYPYTCYWETPERQLRGVSTSEYFIGKDGKCRDLKYDGTGTHYFIPA